ncbi:MAG TPA: hypothetical protein VFW06_11965 [Acidimicrobiia bacterium]|nr:hypothetical protein [Acidimicrobiia bacterium]
MSATEPQGEPSNVDKAKEIAGDVAGKAKDVAGTVGSKAKDVAGEAGKQASGLFAKIKERFAKE